jgi:Flp pilus assembly protein TadB
MKQKALLHNENQKEKRKSVRNKKIKKKKTKRRNIYTVYKKSWRKDWRNSGSFGTNISIASEATRSRK